MTWTPYRGETYLDFAGVEAFCRSLAEAHPEWVTLTSSGTSRQGRTLWLLTLGAPGPDRDDRPAFWIDGGTHAVEWTGVMSVLYAVSRWVEAAVAGGAGAERLRRHTVYAMPCISPDGFQAMHEGAPYIRSNLRPPPEGAPRSGFEPMDIDGDGAVRWMRWRDPAGPFVSDPDLPILMRPRQLGDDPDEAYFVAAEGEFIQWDGTRWTLAPLRFGQDLNRNFPARWKPFSMFGMDAGRFPLSEPESRGLMDAVVARHNIAAALTNHTYTGCILTAPHHPESPLEDGDVLLLESLAREAVEGTGYRVFKTHPEFTYDPKNPVVGAWDDALSSTLGIAAYTLELWDPFGAAGVELSEPAKFFRRPDHDKIKTVVAHFAGMEGVVRDWQRFEHPQLGEVEIGGIDYMCSIRNPPETQLAEECDKGFRIADRIFAALPRVAAGLQVTELPGALRQVELTLENRGFLPTSSLAYAETIGVAAPASASLDLPDGLTLVDGPAERALTHLDGWGNWRVGPAAHAVYPDLPARGHRAVARWLIQGDGPFTVRWYGGRGGRGRLTSD